MEISAKFQVYISRDISAHQFYFAELYAEFVNN